MQTLGPEEGSGPPRERRPGGSWTKVHRTPTTCFLWYLSRWFGHRLFEKKRKEKKITEYSVQNKRPDHSLRAEMALASSTEAAPNMSPHTEYSIVLPIRVCYNGAPPYSNLQSCTPDCRLPFLHFSLTFSLPLSLSSCSSWARRGIHQTRFSTRYPPRNETGAAVTNLHRS